MRVWCDSVDAAATGKTQDTYDSVGTVTIRATGAKHILGIIVNGTASAITSGQNGGLVLQVDSADLGISQQRFLVASVLSDGIATNDKEAPIVSEYIPFKAPNELIPLGNAKVQFSVSGTVTTTGGWDVAIGLVYADELPDQQFFTELMSGICGRASGGAVAFDRAGVSDATYQAFAAGISVSSSASELIGLSGFVNPNAPTAGEACAGVVKFESSSIADFAPQNWPFNIGWNASLGTPVGTIVSASARNGFYYPTRFPLPKVNFTLDVSTILATALSNAGDGVAGAKWR